MKISTRTLLMLPLASALVVGCSDSNDSPANETSAPSPEGEQATVLTKFDGTYLDTCELVDDNDRDEGSQVTSITIAGDTGSLRFFYYTDAACTSPDVPAEAVADISLAYPGGTVQTALGVADFVNITLETVLYDGVPATAEQIQQLNQEGALDTRYDILLLDDSSLYAGDDSAELDGGTEATRPNTLESAPSVRQ